MRKAAVATAMALVAGLAHAGNSDRIDAIRRKMFAPSAGVFVIAHRGCHNPVPSKGLDDSLPENSLPALDRCVALGVDMMETDIHRTRDGGLVIMHDDTVDRTTDGKGAVADLTLAEVRSLHLRRNMGAPTAMAVTAEHVPTLDELLAHAKGRIFINLDIKGPIYREVIESALRDGVGNAVVAKRRVTSVDPAVADTEPFSGVAFAPILDGTAPEMTPQVLHQIVSRQLSGKRPVAMIELSLLAEPQAKAVIEAARASHVRVMSNTLSGVVGVIDRGSDEDALRSPDQVWGRLLDAGMTAFQTDEPAMLLQFLRRRAGADKVY